MKLLTHYPEEALKVLSEIADQRGGLGFTAQQTIKWWLEKEAEEDDAKRTKN